MHHRLLIVMLLALAHLSCQKIELIEPSGFEVNNTADSIVFAQIGDYGYAGIAELHVANLVKSWNPDFIVSVGDNNYYEGKFSTIKANITNYYGDYIYNFDAPLFYQCNGKAFEERINRFFPTPGNHDADNKDGLIPYYNFFSLPGVEKYYKFTWGPATFFSLNSSENNLAEQEAWLRNELIFSTSPFNIVFIHQSPYSSGPHGTYPATDWNYHDMGADLLFAGHDHIYERIQKTGDDDLYYIINGLGGKAKNDCTDPLPSELFKCFCYGSDFGAIKGTATSTRLIIEFYAVNSPDHPIDRFEILK